MVRAASPIDQLPLQIFPQRTSQHREQQNTDEAQQRPRAGDVHEDHTGETFVPARRRGSKQSILPSAAFLAPKRRASSAAGQPVTATDTASVLEQDRRTPESPIVRIEQSEERRRDDEYGWHDRTTEKECMHSSTTEIGSSTATTRRPRTPNPSSATQMTSTSRDPLIYPPNSVYRAGAWKHDHFNGGQSGEDSAETTLGTSNGLPYHAWSDDTAGAKVHKSRPAGSSHHSVLTLPTDAPSQPFCPPGSAIEEPKRRNYTRHKGANHFLCSGILITAEANPWPFIGSLALVVVLGGLWCAFEAPYYWRNISPGVVIIFAYLWLSVFVNMLVTAWQDPGIVPRDLDPDPLMTTVDAVPPSHRVEYDPDDPLYTPIPRIIRIRNGQDLVVKWCETCKTYRPPRSSHCRICNNCVDLIDHHCLYLNTCIGRRNYVSFFAFLIYSIIISIMIMVTSAIHLHLLTLSTTASLPIGGNSGAGMGFVAALRNSPISAVLFLLMIASLIPVCTLFAYHARLVMLGRTTAEQIRINTTRDYTPKEQRSKKRPLLHCTLGITNEDPNPFAYRNPLRNIAQVLLRPAIGIDSYIDSRGWIKRDTRVLAPGSSRVPPLQSVEAAYRSEAGKIGTATSVNTADEPYDGSNTPNGNPLSPSSSGPAPTRSRAASGGRGPSSAS